MHNLQRDRPPWLPEGDSPREPSVWGGQAAPSLLAPFTRPLPSYLQMGKAEGVINAEIPNCWECPRCTQEGRTSKVGLG